MKKRDARRRLEDIHNEANALGGQVDYLRAYMDGPGRDWKEDFIAELGILEGQALEVYEQAQELRNGIEKEE